ncbi:MAG: rRNA maturation RNase YbeY [Pelagibacteraceae bacterium]|jgi:probable rRNA maturation factor|nr:rRNA maturation RNase YbeY [Pelagibacteraceae bacterium]|tara:strand:+ start:20482 stop:20946 length:465 start_codon:yes stop_codon:yes gene_type:complete
MNSKMINADVVVENKLWNKKIKSPSKYIKKKIKKIFKFNSIKRRRFSLTILLTDNSKMKYLNKKFRNKNKITDVLSFPNLEPADLKKKINTEIYLGDIALSYEIINRKSKDSNFNLEFDKMWIHGYLHLLGYNHKKFKDYKIMKRTENKILKIL